VFATLKSPLSKPRAHAMTCMNQYALPNSLALPSLPKQLTLPNPLPHGLPAPTVFDPAFLASALFGPVTAGLYSRSCTARSRELASQPP